MFALSALLFFFGPFEVWSVFTNLLTLPLIVLMFIIEYGVRVRVLPNEQHNALSSVRAYWQSRHAAGAPVRGR
jgi:uncharacterized membrane protein